MRLIVNFFFAATLSWSGVCTAQSGSSFGTFTGILSNTIVGGEQLIKLELIPAREQSGDIRLRAVLTLMFGGFDSSEYITYHFHNVQYNLITGALNFNQTDQEIYIASAKITNNRLRGTLYSSMGEIGPVDLTIADLRRPPRRLIEPLTGEYQGKCGNVPSKLQLYTYRATGDTYRPGNPYKAYEVKGQLGRYSPDYCGREKDKYCVQTKITSASYNFYFGDLVLVGYPYSYNCKINGPALDCGECQFTRSSSEMRNPRTTPVTLPSDPIDKISNALKRNPAASVAGNYVGYIFHENLGVYQKVEIDISTFQRSTDQGSKLFLGAVGRIYFGRSPNESISYRYDAVEFPSPLIKRQFTLAQPEADVDAMLYVNDIRDGVIRGTWYSLIFGKVGSFVATLNGDLPDIPKAQVFGSIAGVYDELADRNGFVVNAVVGRDTAPVGSSNPFYPLSLYGDVWKKNGVVARESITAGSYDFYSGHVTLVYGDQKVVMGKMVPNKTPLFRRLGGGFGTLMQNFEMSSYGKN